MTEKTPLNELIEEIEKERDSYGWDKYTMNMFKDIIDIAKSKLPKERQNLIDAHDKGQQVEEQHTIPQRRINKAEQYVKDKFGI